MSINREQAYAIAALVRLVRSGWDDRPIMDAIAAVSDRPLADVVYAAVRCAQNPANRTPAAIKFEGDHWPPRPATATTPANPRERQALLAAVRDCGLCDDHGRLPAGPLCAHDPDTVERARRGKQLVLAALQAHMEAKP